MENKIWTQEILKAMAKHETNIKSERMKRVWAMKKEKQGEKINGKM
jgi:DNA invertase Pin-like site-specific DNA recombinase